MTALIETVGDVLLYRSSEYSVSALPGGRGLALAALRLLLRLGVVRGVLGSLKIAGS
jgi:hypothetical protein